MIGLGIMAAGGILKAAKKKVLPFVKKQIVKQVEKRASKESLQDSLSSAAENDLRIKLPPVVVQHEADQKQMKMIGIGVAVLAVLFFMFKK